MFHRALVRLTTEAVRKFVKKPWAGRAGPATARGVFLSNYFKGRKGTPDLKTAHAEFDKISPIQLKSLEKIASVNAAKRKSLKEKVKGARSTPYGLFVKKYMGALYKAESPKYKDRKQLFKVVMKQISEKYKKLSASQREALRKRQRSVASRAMRSLRRVRARKNKNRMIE